MAERVLANLEAKFTEGNYYDILQSYKALYNRFSTQKKYKETVTLLESGCNKFLEYKQWNCAADLAKLLIECYKNFKIQYSDESKEPIIKIFKNFKGECAGKISFMRDAIEWSSKNGGDSKGSEEFHTLLAITLSEEGDYIDAQKHFIFGNDYFSFCEMLKNWTEDVDEEEKDLYITRAIFGLLCLKKLKQASDLYNLFTTKVIKGDPSPLLNFDRFLLLTLERDALPLFNLLRQKYERSLKRDPQFKKFLDQIANIFYNVPIQSGGGLGGMLSNLLSGFGGGGMGMGGGNSSGGGLASMEVDGPTIEDEMD
ncbi:hypothetical protein ACTFIW_001146 [Dictyostelium discoideum]